MCRLAAFPPGFSKVDALDVLGNFIRGNVDGTGSVYVKDSQFVVNKWPLPLMKVVEDKLPLLDHMPYDGWTVVHLRAASHGKVSLANTHPFIRGNWAVVHNGVWASYDVVKAALRKYEKFDGETDSEVAAYMIDTIGPKKFFELVNQQSRGGVFLCLERTGNLWVVKTSGILDMATTERGTLLASDLPFFNVDDMPYLKTSTRVDSGWIKLHAQGHIIKKYEPPPAWGWNTAWNGQHAGYIGQRSEPVYDGFAGEIPGAAIPRKSEQGIDDPDLWKDVLL